MTINNKSYSSPKNINLKEGILRFNGTFSANPLDDTGNGFWVNESNQMVYSAQTVDTILGSAGSLVNFGLNDSYDDGNSINVDGGAVTLAGTHATNNVLAITSTGSTTGNLIDLQNNSSGSAGYDIEGTDDSWNVSVAGTALLVGITGCDALTAAANLTLEATGAGTITIGGTSSGGIDIGTGGGTLTVATDLVVTGSADATVLTITAGDVEITAGLLSLDDDDTATGNLVIPSSTATSGHPIKITADDLTSGSAIYIDSDNGASFSGDGGYFNAMNGTSSVFKIGRYGATTIAGNAGSDVFTVTAGDLVVSDGSLIITDGDNASTVSITNNTATTAAVLLVAGSGAFTGDSFVEFTPSGLTTGSAVGITADALTTGEALVISVDVITSGKGIFVENTGEAITSGELLTILNNESGNIATITGNVVSFTSAIDETAGTLTADYDLALFSRTDKQSFAAQYDAQGSVVKISKTQNKVAGTIVDAVIGLEIVSTSTGSALILGDSVKITSVGVNERSLNVVNAATGKDAVLITASGALTNGLAGLHITSSGDLATGGANLILTVSGAACDAAARAFEIDAQKDVQAMYIDTDGITNDAIYITHSGNLAASKAVMHITDAGIPAADNVYVVHFAFTGTATNESSVLFLDGGGKDVNGLLVDADCVYSAANNSGHITLYSDAAGNLPVFMNFYHEDAGAVSGEYAAKLFFYGSDDAPAKELYASIEVEMDDTAAANPDGILWIKGDLAGTNTVSAGFTGNMVMLGAAASTLTSAGAWDLTISTNKTAGSEPTIVLTDGAAGNVTVTAGGTSGEIDLASPVVHSSTQSITGSGTINVTTSITELDSTGGGAYGMNDGVEGQIKTIVFKTDGGDAVITPTSFAQTNITFDTVGESAVLQFTNSKWYLLGTNGGVVT